MVLAKQVGENPRELAEKIVAAIPEHEDIATVEVAGPGFINFHLSESYFTRATNEALGSGEAWGRSAMYDGKHFLIEHSSPNLFKPFHIGHLVNNTLGESLVRLARFAGAKITVLSWPSDVSPGIAKAVWGAIDKGWQDDLTIERIGEAYAHGVARYEADETTKKEIDALNVTLYNHDTSAPEWRVYENGRKLSLMYFESITQRLGSKFDGYIFESESEETGKKIIKEHTPGVFEESEGAIIFRGSEHGSYDSVFINSAGFGTYLAKDIGLLSQKFSSYTFDQSLTLTDIEQKHHFELVRAAAAQIDPDLTEKSKYLQHGRLRLTSGKISSRSGNVPLAEDILDTVKKRALERMVENDREADDRVAERVATAAVKYAIARVGMGKNITFDLEESLSFEGNSGPYLQYTHARAQSILRKAESRKASDERGGLAVTEVERLLYRFPHVIERAVSEYEPHHVANYLSELASAYNSWYAAEQVLDGGEAEGYKLALNKAVATTLKNGLWLLGIEAPENM
jgi:arginyl-tRNA synthetase